MKQVQRTRPNQQEQKHNRRQKQQSAKLTAALAQQSGTLLWPFH